MIVDLFAGPGGLDVAAHWLGIPSVGIEFDESAVRTREAAGLSSIFSDVRSWRPTDFSSAVNVLAGGPPCQTYTVAGNGHGRLALTRVIQLVRQLGHGLIDEVVAEASAQSDPRTGLVLQPLIWALLAIEAGRPFEAIMLEQVPQVRLVWDVMAEVLESRGYGTDVAVLRTEEYGVPQTRRRAVLIARHGIPSTVVKLPWTTHRRYDGRVLESDAIPGIGCKLPRWVTMGEALKIDEPFVVVSNYGTGGDPRNRGRRNQDCPAFTVTGKASRNKIVMADGGGTQRFGPKEAGRLQTFPDGYPWAGCDVSQQIGNAIPPRLGAHVLCSLLGIEPRPDEAFFAERQSAWKSPTRAVQTRVRDAIIRCDVLEKSPTLIVGPSDCAEYREPVKAYAPLTRGRHTVQEDSISDRHRVRGSRGPDSEPDRPGAAVSEQGI